MPVNYDGPYEVRTFYTTTIGSRVLQHRNTVDVRLASNPAPGDAFSGIMALTWNGNEVLLSTLLNTLLTLVRAFYPSSADFVSRELWRYPDEGSNAQFISTESIGLPGTSAGSSIEAQQMTLTFRTTGGGIMRGQWMEPTSIGNARDSFPTSIAARNVLMQAYVDANACFVGRDNTRPFAPIAFSLGQNEKLWRKRFRD